MTILKKLAQYLRPKQKRRVVYTCMFGHSERFCDFKYERDDNTDFVCFTDDPKLKSDFWKVIQAPPSTLDPHRRSKGFKHKPHLLFPRYSESLYIDNTIRLKMPPAAIFDEFLLPDTVLRAFRHPHRDCAYEEAQIVAAMEYDHADIIDEQMNYYRSQGYPEHNGLNATGILLRRHNDPLLIETMETWNADMLRFSKRDQLSFNFAVSRHGMRLDAFPGLIHDNEILEWLLNLKRLPRDFDEQRYLDLNADVARTKVNPRYHYLHHGMNEGRAYK
jgi:hypothetical protein